MFTHSTPALLTHTPDGVGRLTGHGPHGEGGVDEREHNVQSVRMLVDPAGQLRHQPQRGGTHGVVGGGRDGEEHGHGKREHLRLITRGGGGRSGWCVRCGVGGVCVTHTLMEGATAYITNRQASETFQAVPGLQMLA